MVAGVYGILAWLGRRARQQEEMFMSEAAAEPEPAAAH
jgi:hypothetical protein